MNAANNQIEKKAQMARVKRMAGGTAKWIFLGIVVIFTIYPIVYTILGSLKTNAELTQGGSFLPSEWHFENYYKAFMEADFLRYRQQRICQHERNHFSSRNLFTGWIHSCQKRFCRKKDSPCPLYVHDVRISGFYHAIPDL